VPGDGVTIVYDESEEVEPETLPPIMTTQPTPSSADGEGTLLFFTSLFLDRIS